MKEMFTPEWIDSMQFASCIAMHNALSCQVRTDAEVKDVHDTEFSVVF